MKKFISALPILLLFACSDEDLPTEKFVETSDTTELVEDSHDVNKDIGSANKDMDETAVEELMKQFESPERDNYQQPEKVLAYLGNIKGKKIMDLGAGSGYFSVKLAKKGAIVIAADVDGEFQEQIKRFIESENLHNIETRIIPYDSPKLKDEEVDMVLIVNSYHHIESRPEYFRKVKKGTKKTGELVVIDFFKKEMPVGPPVHQKISSDDVVKELIKAGYTSFDVNVDLLPNQYIIRAK